MRVIVTVAPSSRTLFAWGAVEAPPITTPNVPARGTELGSSGSSKVTFSVAPFIVAEESVGGIESVVLLVTDSSVKPGTTSTALSASRSGLVSGAV